MYSKEIKKPKNLKEGLENFVQMIINSLEEGDQREALLTAVNLRNDLNSGIYDSAITTRMSNVDVEIINEQLKREYNKGYQTGHEEGRIQGAKEKAIEIRNALNL